MIGNATRLQRELDAFTAGTEGLRHSLVAYFGDDLSMTWGKFVGDDPCDCLGPAAQRSPGTVDHFRPAFTPRRRWAYFDRHAFTYGDHGIVIASPMERMWWTQTAAVADSDEIIASLVTGEVE